jgi:hypothetical protein
MPRLGRPRDRHKEQFWRQTLQRFAASRLSAAQFCRLHKLSLHTFWAWRRTLRLREQPTTAPDSSSTKSKLQTPHSAALPLFLPLQVQHQPPASQTHSTAPSVEVLLPNGLRLVVPQHFDPDTLQRLLALLRGASC